ncbi:dienelactone hydrolase family protein [Tsuneonella sp. HG222]
MKRVILLASALGMASGVAAQTAPASTEQHYYARPVEGEAKARPWLVLMPGGGGMDVFGDTEHYFNVAREWNAAGWDVLLVHYQEAAKLIPGAAQSNPARMETTVIADALNVAGAKGWLDLQCPGMVMGFSMGGAGTLGLAADPPKTLIGAIGYYPMTAGQAARYTPKVPVLVLQGDLDQLTTRDALDALVAKSADRSKLSVFHFPSAHHGFDIPSLAKPVTFNGGTFRYNNGAALAAQAEVEAFRKTQLAAANAPAECR